MPGNPDIIDPKAPITVKDAAKKGSAVIGGDTKAPATHLDQEISDMTPGFIKKAGEAIGAGAAKVATAFASLDHQVNKDPAPAAADGTTSTDASADDEAVQA